MDLLDPPTPIHTIAERMADLYPDHPSVRRVLSAAHVPLGRVLFHTAINTWYYAVAEAAQHRRLLALVEVALSEYPHDLMLNAIHNKLITQGD